MRFLLIFLLGFFCAPASAKTLNGENVFTVSGTVRERTPQRTPVSRRIVILPMRKGTDMEGKYLKNEAEVIARTVSDAQGKFSLKIPSGPYSIFVEENGRLYCGYIHKTGLACPLWVREGDVQQDLAVDPAAELPKKDFFIPILEEERACQKDADCVAVSDHCGACSCGDALNETMRSQYEERYRSYCAQFDALPMCDMDCPSKKPSCQDGQCRLVGVSNNG